MPLRLKSSFFIFLFSVHAIADGFAIDCKNILAAIHTLQKSQFLVEQANPELVKRNISLGSCGLVCRANYFRIVERALGRELHLPNQDFQSNVTRLDNLGIESRFGFYVEQLSRILDWDTVGTATIVRRGRTYGTRLTPEDVAATGLHGQLKFIAVNGTRKEFNHFLLLHSFNEVTGEAKLIDPNWANEEITAKIVFDGSYTPAIFFKDKRYNGVSGFGGYGANDYRLHDMIYLDRP